MAEPSILKCQLNKSAFILIWIDELEHPLTTIIQYELCLTSQTDILIGRVAVSLLRVGSLPIFPQALCSMLAFMWSE